MSNPTPLVSIGLPVRNAGSRIAEVVRSVMAQDHPELELVISDNGSTDDTEAVCRELARDDSRIAYHRQPENIGLFNNFVFASRAAKGSYLRWIGDDDRLEPTMVSRCLREFEDDRRLVLVTTGIAYTGPDGATDTAPYESGVMRSDDPAVRFAEWMTLLNSSHLLLDPMYALLRRDVVIGLPRRKMLHEDEIFASKLALAGPWGHVAEILAHRNWRADSMSALGRRLDVPKWQWRMHNALQARETIAWVNQADLTDEQRRQAIAAVRRFYLARQWNVIERRSRKLVRIATGR